MNLYLASMILVPNITQAYLQSKGDDIDFLSTGNKVNWSKNENTFAVYDNFNPDNMGKNQILFPRSKYFISADVISIAFPLPIVFYSHTTTENALADLLYANLKLKKLVEEYENIQKTSEKLIWNSQDLFQLRDNEVSVYQINNRFIESSNRIVEDSRFALNLPSSSRPSIDRNNRVRPNFRSTANRSNYNRTVRNHTFADQDAVEHDEDENRSLKKIRNKPYTEGSYPWIVGIFTKIPDIIPYLIANKWETLFYGVGLYITSIVLVLILKR